MKKKNINLSASPVHCAFTLVEMLMALLIISVIISASIPVISKRINPQQALPNQYSSVPIGLIAIWSKDKNLPDNTWLEANGQAIPNGIEYEEIRQIYGTNLPDLRGILSQSLPQNLIAIWGTNDAIPPNWSEAEEYRGLFLRGWGNTGAVNNNWYDKHGIARSESVTYSSGNIGEIQHDGMRNLWGLAHVYQHNSWRSGAVNNLGAIRTDVYDQPERYAWGGVGSGYADGVSAIYLDSSRLIPVSNEIRPVNKAVRFIKHTPPAEKFRYIVKVKN